MIHYTYIYYDPSRNNEPFYVGMGKHDRAWHHLKARRKSPFIQRLQKMIRCRINPVIGIYAGLEQEFAALLEQELISKFGRKDLGKGSLLNLTDGGEGTKHRLWTDKQREQSSKDRSGTGNPNYGNILSTETKMQIGKSQPKTKVYSVESREKQTIRQLGSKNVMFGKMPTNTKPVTYNGRGYPSMKSAAADNNISHATLCKRMIQCQEVT